jgi:hypothetical protein
MPYSRQRPRIAPTGRIALRLTPEQRDLFLGSGHLPKDLGHVLHRAAVRQGKLMVRLSREELDTLIAAGAKVSPSDAAAERNLDTLLRYLESLADRFEDASDEVVQPE